MCVEELGGGTTGRKNMIREVCAEGASHLRTKPGYTIKAVPTSLEYLAKLITSECTVLFHVISSNSGLVNRNGLHLMFPF